MSATRNHHPRSAPAKRADRAIAAGVDRPAPPRPRALISATVAARCSSARIISFAFTSSSAISLLRAWELREPVVV